MEFVIMYDLTVHPDAQRDLHAIAAGDPQTAGRIAVCLQELTQDEHLRRNMAVEDHNFSGAVFRYNGRAVKLFAHEVWRLKARDGGRLIPYRLIYVFDDRRRLIHFLAIMPRMDGNEGYEDAPELIERITAAIDELNL